VQNFYSFGNLIDAFNSAEMPVGPSRQAFTIFEFATLVIILNKHDLSSNLNFKQFLGGHLVPSSIHG
jgi:hypothetical protein